MLDTPIRCSSLPPTSLDLVTLERAQKNYRNFVTGYFLPASRRKKSRVLQNGSKTNQDQPFFGWNWIQAEARLAARRQARYEARNIRLKELEKKQKEDDENKANSNHVYPDGVRMREERRREATKNLSSRRSSTDSSEDGFNLNVRDLKNDLRDVEEKFRKAMVTNASLDNEKAQLTYQVDLLKDQLEEREEQNALVVRELREKNREFELMKRSYAEAQRAVQLLQAQMDEQARLLSERGMVLIGQEDCDEDESAAVDESEQDKRTRAIVSSETANILGTLGQGPLDVRIKRLADERDDLQDSVRRLKLDLEEERSRNSKLEKAPFNPEEADWETKKLIDDYKFKMQKAEQDINTLQTNVARMESQVIRYKSAAETSEKSEEELKVERRKLQRELREATTRVEELETTNKHLETRLGKLKTAKSNLLKEL
ncbi:leucine-rich repeat flightless-interacting protein 2-like isoform X2 [Tigriopus californicus]|uniref:leucine-rich repeat flightless-interacting protein 2-like isoform X2 n=1 Tax=Tigriopus californicus TaxID=6832 RepID=UPI0027DA6C0B|nr:leucine-rich repeat flightless-interacting protein 2-like isoform X2 [Tigriopus californicus]